LDPGQEQEAAAAERGGEESGGKQGRYIPVDRSSPWPDTRQKVAQLVWGDGFVGPGDADSCTEMVQAVGLDESSNMLEIGAGVGGGTRAVAAVFGAYVAGWDLEPELAAEATIQAEVHSLELKAAVKPLDPEQVEFKPNFYIGAVIRETLYRIADKKSFLAKVVESLKPGGHLLISDLFFADDAATSEMDRWRDGERSEAYGWRIDEARDVFTKLSVDVRVTTDESDAYCARILDAWKNFVPTVGDHTLGDDLALPSVDEAEFWARRLTAIQSGDLRFFRITCLKKKLVA